MKKSHRISGIILIALILTVATFAFAAANNVPATAAGDGAGTISGYTVSNVQYTLGTANPVYITQVTFTLTPTVTTLTGNVNVDIQLITDGAWFSCTDPISAAGGSVTCPITADTITAEDADTLHVVAYQ